MCVCVGGGGGVMLESRPWYGKWKIGGVFSIQVHVDLQITIKGQIGDFELH